MEIILNYWIISQEKALFSLWYKTFNGILITLFLCNFETSHFLRKALKVAKIHSVNMKDPINTNIFIIHFSPICQPVFILTRAWITHLQNILEFTGFILLEVAHKYVTWQRIQRKQISYQTALEMTESR